MIFRHILGLMGLVIIFSVVDATSSCALLKKINLSDESIIRWKAEFLHSASSRSACAISWPQTILRLRLYTEANSDTNLLVEKLSRILANFKSEQIFSEMCIRGIDDGVVQLIIVSRPCFSLKVRSTRKNKVVLHAIRNLHLAAYQRTVYV